MITEIAQDIYAKPRALTGKRALGGLNQHVLCHLKSQADPLLSRGFLPDVSESFGKGASFEFAEAAFIDFQTF